MSKLKFLLSRKYNHSFHFPNNLMQSDWLYQQQCISILRDTFIRELPSRTIVHFCISLLYNCPAELRHCQHQDDHVCFSYRLLFKSASVKWLIAVWYADIKRPVNRKKLGVIVRGHVLLFPTEREIVYSSAAISVYNRKGMTSPTAQPSQSDRHLFQPRN